MTKVGDRNKVLFQEPLNHAAVGTWIKSGALRYLVVNNRAVLDMPGEFVCTQVSNVSSCLNTSGNLPSDSPEPQLMCPGSRLPELQR